MRHQHHVKLKRFVETALKVYLFPCNSSEDMQSYF